MKIKLSFGPNYQEFEIGEIAFLAKDKPLRLSCGVEISNFPLAYQTYGKLNQDHSNAILVFHALTADQYAASTHPVTGKNGWWDFMIGQGKPIDTNKFFVICVNALGGCMGSFGPKTINLETNQPYGLSFPVLTINDMVNAQNLLLEELGIKKLYAAIGGSMGGMQALAFSCLYPNKVDLTVVMASSYRHSPQNIAFHEAGRQAVMADPDWLGGKYFLENKFPKKGLAVARMIAHITYLSQTALQNKFGRNLQNKSALSYGFEADFQIESYLHHQGYSFVERFDANSYLYLTRAIDYFDLESDFGGKLYRAFSGIAKNKNSRVCLISFSDDWLFPAEELKKLTHSLIACDINVSSINMHSRSGHDSFLIRNDPLEKMMAGLLTGF